MTCQLAPLFTPKWVRIRTSEVLSPLLAWHGFCEKGGKRYFPPAFHGAIMNPELQPPLPLSQYHFAAMQLPPVPPPTLAPRGHASSLAPRAVSATSIAEARLRSILMGV